MGDRALLRMHYVRLYIIWTNAKHRTADQRRVPGESAEGVSEDADSKRVYPHSPIAAGQIQTRTGAVRAIHQNHIDHYCGLAAGIHPYQGLSHSQWQRSLWICIIFWVCQWEGQEMVIYSFWLICQIYLIFKWVHYVISNI